jgi:hypothetical protein
VRSASRIGLTPEVGGRSSRPNHGLTTVVICSVTKDPIHHRLGFGRRRRIAHLGPLQHSAARIFLAFLRFFICFSGKEFGRESAQIRDRCVKEFGKSRHVKGIGARARRRQAGEKPVTRGAVKKPINRVNSPSASACGKKFACSTRTPFVSRRSGMATSAKRCRRVQTGATILPRWQSTRTLEKRGFFAGQVPSDAIQ